MKWIPLFFCLTVAACAASVVPEEEPKVSIECVDKLCWSCYTYTSAAYCIPNK